MQLTNNINPIAFIDGLDDDAFLQFQAAAERRAEEVRIRNKADAIIEVNSKIKFYGLTLSDLPELKAQGSTKRSKGTTIPIKYYDPLTGSHWSGNGSAPAAFAESNNHDKANPITNPKRMDQYLIPDGEFGVQIALKIKKNVRTKSGLVINYADLITSSPTLSATSIAT